MYAYVYCTAGHDVSQLTAERIHQYEPFAATFNIAKIQLELHEAQAPGFAARLGMNFSFTTYSIALLIIACFAVSLGFVNFAFDVKSQFFSVTGQAFTKVDFVAKSSLSNCYMA